ncbi:MAG: NAD(P)/FAD-dependent oxidoreductase [Synechococcales bacterium]|nr:NAD(P)/FAD-dependent oxidoreductase [Synechococcales bacterium]
MECFDYVILGAGLGGLAVAACLAQTGDRVLVLEQHYLPGGCCHTFDYGKYKFCADVHYISQCGSGQIIAEFFNRIGKNVEFLSLEPDCIDLVITPEATLAIPLGWENLRQRLLQQFPNEAIPIHRYCDEIKALRQQMKALNQEISWYDRHLADWLKLPKYLHLFHRRDWTLQDLYDQTGLSPKLQALLAGQSGDYALPPNQISLISHTALVSDYAEGAYYPKHHFSHFVNTIVDAITETGGIVKFSTPVEAIQISQQRVQSVQAGGQIYTAAKAFISDLDPKLTVQLMQGEPMSAKEHRRLTSYQYSSSAFNVYLGLDASFNPSHYGLGNLNVWYYPDGDLNHAYDRQLKGDLDHPWIFLSCPTLKSPEPGIAPEGHHVLEVATVCPYAPFKHLHDTDLLAYHKLKRHVYQQIMTSVTDLIPDIKSHLRMTVYGTPTTSEYFLGQPEGNIYGANLIPQQVGLHRLGYKTELPNLFLVGASSGYPSVPGVISNGMDVADLLTQRSIATPLPLSKAGFAS